ncbi:MAG: aminotransferase class IV [Acidimicrobiia bacterium]|nr:aminotransferase class IV [Acidimicrobiia bacterium]
MRVLVDGSTVEADDASVSVFDWAVQRGFGVFEVVRSYGGAPFHLGPHLDRLERSAAALALTLPDRKDLDDWVRRVADAGGDCQVRVIVTGGGRDPLVDVPGRTIVAWEPLSPVPDLLRVLPMTAHWHPGEAAGPLYGIKWLSYAPNMASSDLARRQGFDDALLSSRDGWVLEGPTFCVAWVADGRIETPELGLGILASITRSTLFETADAVGLDVVEGRWSLDRVLGAEEVLALSTTKEVAPIGTVGDTEVSTGPVAGRLLAAFRDLVAAES